MLLGYKKRGFGMGRWNGFGGKIEAGETVAQAACRELGEESGLKAAVEDLELAAVIRFYMGGEAVFECSIFFVRAWTGEPIETEEMRPEWYATSELPFHAMWPDDAHWMPMVLGGKRFRGEIFLDAEGKQVEKFEWQEGL